MSEGRRIPRAGWLCALVAACSALCWALITPVFHVPDEVSHFAYAQYLAETGELPRENGDLAYSDEEQIALDRLEFYEVVGDGRSRPPWTEAQDRALDEAPDGDRISTGNAQSATNNPPLYYALQAVPYHLAGGLSLPDRLMIMRLLSVALAACTALACFLFVREVLPGQPWAWTAGGLVAGLQPLFGFVSSGVQGDALLYATSALLLLAVARAFRRGLRPSTGIAIGVAVTLGMLAKLTFIGLVPGAVLAVLLLAWRARSGPDRGTARRGAAVALAAMAAGALVYAGLNVLVFDRPLLPGSEVSAGAPSAGNPAVRPMRLGEGVSYIWQLYLPRLPFMADQFPGGNPMPNLWLHGWIGRFGWLDTAWPDVVYRSARWVLVALAALALAVASRRLARGAWRERWPELASYAVIALGLLVLIGIAGYRARQGAQPGFEQARYLLPLLPLYAAGSALAARAFGRWGPVAATVLVVAALGHDVFAQLLTISRFYG